MAYLPTSITLCPPFKAHTQHLNVIASLLSLSEYQYSKPVTFVRKTLSPVCLAGWARQHKIKLDSY